MTDGKPQTCTVGNGIDRFPRAESDIEREQAIRIYDEALATRETDPWTAAEVIIMQRLHERGQRRTRPRYRRPGPRSSHAPEEFDERRRCVTRWGRDPRAEDGELLWPGQFPRQVIRRPQAPPRPLCCQRAIPTVAGDPRRQHHQTGMVAPLAGRLP